MLALAVGEGAITHVSVVWNDRIQLTLHAHCRREQLKVIYTAWWRHQALSICDR